MKRRMPPLNHLRAFEAAARHQSFTKAAEELHVTQGAISRHIRTLEEYLGFDLFDRSTSGVHLLDASRPFALTLTKAFDSINKAAETLEKDQRRTILEIRGYTNFLVRWLLPKIPEFQALHPDIEVRFSSGRAEANFGIDGPDAAVRYGHGRWDGVEAELLFEDELLPNCSPTLAKSLQLKTPDDILNATVYHAHGRRYEWPQWFKLVSKEPFAPEREVYPEDLAVAHQCVLAGMGVGLGQREYIKDDIEAGRLVIPFDIPLKRSSGFYFVYPEAHRDIPKLVAFRNWIMTKKSVPQKAQIVPINQRQQKVA